MFKKEKVYLINDIEEYGKLIAYCIDNDINVFRTYWDDRIKGSICYHINWKHKRCFYADVDYYRKNKGFIIVKPIFSINEFGIISLKDYTLEVENEKENG